MCGELTVFVVDDDVQARQSVCALVTSMGKKVQAFGSAEEFLGQYESQGAGCLVTDLRLPGMSGLELQEMLLERGESLPVIVLTGFARTPIAVRAMRAGAITMLDKPYHDDELWHAIRQALAESGTRRAHVELRRSVQQRMATLTPAEREVMDRIIEGMPNKAIARELDISLRTVESRRHAVLAKMQVASIAELVRLITRAELV